MVLAQRVGKPRPFLAGFLLSIVTALVYSIYWNYRAHNEVYRQFELQKEGRDEGVVWYVLGIILPPFLLAYWWTMVGNVRYVRERMGLRRGVSPGTFVTLTTLAFAAYFAALILVVLASNIDPAKATPAEQQTLDTLLSVAGTLALACLALGGIAYYRLQHDINELWHAYDVRMLELSAPPGPPPAAQPAWPPPPA